MSGAAKIRIAATATAAAAFLTAAAVGGRAGARGAEAPPVASWPQFHFDAAHTGYNPGERVLGRATVARLRQAWVVDTGAMTGGAQQSSPAVAGDLVYLHADRFQAYDARTGALQAERAGSGAALGPVAVAAGLAHAVRSDGAVETSDARTGAMLWTGPRGSSEGSAPPVTAAGRFVYVAGDDLVALEARTGRVAWRRSLECFLCAPAVAGGLVYTLSGARTLVALDARTGRRRWTRAAPQRSFVWGAFPAVAGGRVIVPAGRGSSRREIVLYALDARTGRVRWAARAGRSPVLPWSAPAIARGVVYYSSPDGYLNAFRLATGRRLWRATLETRATVSSPAVANGVVYVGGACDLFALDAKTGEHLWQACVEGSLVDSSPAVAGGAVYVASSTGKLYRFDLEGAAGTRSGP